MATISARSTPAPRELGVRLVCEEEELSASQLAIYTEWEKKVKEYDELIKKHKDEENKYNKAVKAVDTRVGMKEAERHPTGPTKFLRAVPHSISEGATAHLTGTQTTSPSQLGKTTDMSAKQPAVGVSNHNLGKNITLQVNSKQHSTPTGIPGVNMQQADRGNVRMTWSASQTPASVMSSRQAGNPGVVQTKVSRNGPFVTHNGSQQASKPSPGVSSNQANVLRNANLTNLLQFGQRGTPTSTYASNSSQNPIVNRGLKRPADSITSQESKRQKETALDTKTLPMYYGYKRGVQIPGEEGNRRFKIKCFHCNETMASNVQYADHVKKIVENQWPHSSSNLSAMVVCPRCFKRFRTPYEMQEHLERSHVKGSFFQCFTCDLSFSDNSVLMKHMSQFHAVLQMPFLCQICQYRTSSYTDIMTHFACKHEGFKALMCPYCLRVLRCSKTFLGHCQKHVQLSMRSQMGSYTCKMCKLSFLSSAERSEHIERDHKRLNITDRDGVPKVVRDMLKSFQIMETAGINSPAGRGRDPPQFSGKQFDFKYVYIPKSTLNKQMSCMECGQQFSYLGNHFNRILHCELCSYTTLCPQSFTNHMILFHKHGRQQPKIGVVSKKVNSDGTVLLTCKACSYQTTSPTHMAHHRGKKCKDRTQLEWISYLFVPSSSSRTNLKVNDVVVLDSDDDS